MEKNNENFTPIEEKKEGKSVWRTVKKICITTLKVVGIAGAGAAAGYVARKYVDKDIYDAAQRQFDYENRKNGNNN